MYNNIKIVPLRPFICFSDLLRGALYPAGPVSCVPLLVLVVLLAVLLLPVRLNKRVMKNILILFRLLNAKTINQY